MSSRKRPTKFGYRGIIRVEDVYDGDSCRCDLDLGLGVWVRRAALRLANINCPELRGSTRAAGIEARNFLRDMIPDDGEVLVRTTKKGKYGRWIAEIWIEKGPQRLVCVNDEMLRAGHATKYID